MYVLVHSGVVDYSATMHLSFLVDPLLEMIGPSKVFVWGGVRTIFVTSHHGLRYKKVEVASFSNDSGLYLRIGGNTWPRTLDAVSFDIGEEKENGESESGRGDQEIVESFVEGIIEGNF